MRRLPRNVWIVTATSFLTDISSEMIVYLLPLYLANLLGVKTNIIGLIDGLAEMVSSLLKLFSGWLSDKLHSRKWLTVFGYALSTLSKPFLLLAHSWSTVLAVRLADRTGKGIRNPPRDALVADSVDESQRGLAFGVHRAGDTAGAALGLLTAVIVVALTQRSSLVLTLDTFRTLVVLSVVPAVIAVGVLAFGAKETRGKVDGKLPTLSWAGFDRRFKLFLVVIVLFTLGNSSDAFLVLRAQDRGASVLTILLMIFTFNVVYALASGPAGRLSDRVGRKRVILAGWILYALVYLGFAVAGATWQIFGLYITYGLYYALTEGIARAMIADLVAPRQRGIAYGLYNAAVGLTAFPASFLAGVLWQGLGPFTGFGAPAPFLFGALLALISAILLTIV